MIMTKPKIFKITLIFGIIIVFLCTIVLVFGIANFFYSPKTYENPSEVNPVNLIYGNSSMNLSSEGTGSVCQWHDNILIATKEKIILVSSDLRNYSVIVDVPAHYLNIIEDNLYYISDNDIYKVNLNTSDIDRVLNTTSTSISHMYVIGDKLFYCKYRDISYIGCVNLQNNQVNKLNTKIDIWRTAGYKDNCFYYCNTSGVYYYDIIKNKEAVLIPGFDTHISDLFLLDDSLYIVVSDHNYVSALKVYNFLTTEYEDISLYSENSNRIYFVKVFKDRIVYFDSSSTLYIFNRKLDDLVQIENTDRCVELYVTSDAIVTHYTARNISYFVFYDEYGNVLGKIYE